MKMYLVITPEMGEVIPICDDGTGPMEYHRDVIEIEAESKRDAVIMGVREMLNNPRYTYCMDQRLDGCSPYIGVRAEPIECEDADTMEHALPLPSEAP